MTKAVFELEIDENGCQLSASQAGIPLCEWNGEVCQLGMGFLELVMLLEETN